MKYKQSSMISSNTTELVTLVSNNVRYNFNGIMH